jgi:hypothetical protein
MLVAHDEKEIDHDVYHGRSTVTAEMDEDLLEDAARSDD